MEHLRESAEPWSRAPRPVSEWAVNRRRQYRPKDRTILVVDDDEACRTLMSVLLKVKGYPVATAETGLDALRLLQAGLVPWLIVLDMCMPEMSGLEFRAEQLRDAILARIPVIVVTALDDPVAIKALGSIAGFFLKPINTRAFLKAIEPLEHDCLGATR